MDILRKLEGPRYSKITINRMGHNKTLDFQTKGDRA